MNEQAKPECATCTYWTSGPRSFGDHIRECRRLPPVRQLLINGDTRPEWPETDKRDWCGEHPDFPAWIKATRESPATAPDATVNSSLGAKIVTALLSGKINTLRLRQTARDHDVSLDQAKRVMWHELAARNPALFQQLGGIAFDLPSATKLFAMLRNADQFGF